MLCEDRRTVNDKLCAAMHDRVNCAHRAILIRCAYLHRGICAENWTGLICCRLWRLLSTGGLKDHEGRTKKNSLFIIVLTVLTYNAAITCGQVHRLSSFCANPANWLSSAVAHH